MAAANFFRWEDICPELRTLQESIGVMEEELRAMESALASGGFVSWPEDLLGMNSRGKGAPSDWSVFPLLHTFPASNVANSQWIDATIAHFPRTTALLRGIPNIRTALFSRLGPGTVVVL